jgi:hypothetical protein
MKQPIGYASVAIMELLNSDQIAIEVISITPDVCELSGAWVVGVNEKKVCQQIIEGRLILLVEENDALVNALSTNKSSVVKLNDFLTEAISEVKISLEAYKKFVSTNEEDYRAYMAVSPSERKLLPKVVKKTLNDPDFFSWPSSFGNEDAASYLESIGKLGVIRGGDPELARTLALARTLKFFVEKWKSDEIERKNKIYVGTENAEVTILPNCWLSKIPL